MAKKLTPETVGKALGQLANRIDAWKKQRDELIVEGERLAGVALGFVKDLRGQRTPTPPTKADTKGGRTKGSKMSEETKAKLRAAWKRRKAKQNAAGAEDTKSGDQRARVRASTGRVRSARQSGRG
jgi:hypothetical protein